MKKLKRETVHNRFVQEPDETVMIIDGKKMVWGDNANAFVNFRPKDSNNKKPLVFTNKMKDHLEDLMSRFTHGRAKKWSKNRT